MVKLNMAKCSQCGEYKECRWFETDEVFKTESGRVLPKHEPICSECLTKEAK